MPWPEVGKKQTNKWTKNITESNLYPCRYSKCKENTWTITLKDPILREMAA